MQDVVVCLHHQRAVVQYVICFVCKGMQELPGVFEKPKLSYRYFFFNT